MFYTNIFKSKLNIFLTSVLLMGFGLGLASNTFAQTCTSCPQFNICSNDEETLTLKNRTQGNTVWQDPISADCGERVAFDVYYHNGITGSTANNTKIKLNYNCAENSQIVTTAYLWADNASTVSDTGTINVSTPQELIFDSTAKWYPNQGTTPTAISVTQVGSCGVQVNIGDINGNWTYQGHVVFEATLTSCSTSTPTVDIEANGSDGPISISYNNSANLSWTSTNATSCYASGNWSGSKSLSGNESTGSLTYSRTYTITCSGTGGSASDSVTVNVTSSTPTIDIKANGSDGTITIPYNDSAILNWTSANATSCYASGNWSGSKSTSGSESTGNLTYSKTYTITCSGSGGSASDSVTINVNNQSISDVYLTADPSSGCYPLNNVDLTATVSDSYYYGSITYYFDCTNDGYWEKTITDSSSYYTAYDVCNYYSAGTYTARVRAERGGQNAEDTTQIYVSSCYTQTPTVDIKANGSDGTVTIPYNSSANLNWTSANATSCYASGNWSGYKSTYGSESTGSLTYSRTYTITCSGSGGSASDSVTVNNGTTSGLSIAKSVRNLSDGTGWQETVNADPTEVLSFSIQITVSGSTSQNVSVKDTLPAKIIYQGNLKIDNVFSAGDIISGLNIGALYSGQVKTVTFDARVADADQFNLGTTELVNTALVYTSATSTSDTAKVNVAKTAVAGAITEVVTGINLLYFSLMIAFLLSLG
jgi:hypothetical protein